MKKMFKGALFFACLLSQGLFASCDCTSIDQAAIDVGCDIYTITTSGKYCLAEDVHGQIHVDADCVCLDLCCHTLDANGAANAIAAAAHASLEVFKEALINSVIPSSSAFTP